MFQSREKQLQGQIASQQKVIESLKSDIQDKVKVIKELQEQLLSQVRDGHDRETGKGDRQSKVV